MDWSHTLRLMGALFIFVIYCPITVCNLYYAYAKWRIPLVAIPAPIPVLGSLLGIAAILLVPFWGLPLRAFLILVVVGLSDASWYFGSTFAARQKLS